MSQQCEQDTNTASPRIAVLGCGGWGKNITKTLARVHEVAAVADPSESARALASEIAPGARVASDPMDLINDPSIDAVMIATPAETHHDLARAAMHAGKDVFVEKPITIDTDEAVKLRDLAGALDRILMVGHLLEYHPAILKLRELIDNGELGDIWYAVSNRTNLGKFRTFENALWSFAPHDISVLLRLIGEDPEQIVCTGGDYLSKDIADVTVTQMKFPGGARAHIFVSWLHPFKEQKLVVVGSKKMATFDDVARELVLHETGVDWQEGQPIPVKSDGVQVEYDTTAPLDLEVLHFVNAVRTHTQPLTDAHEGVRVLRILHTAQESLVKNGAPVDMSPTINITTQEAVGAR